jgi:hypothetical protein
MSTTVTAPKITADTRLRDVLETEVCGRCGGSGHYSYNQIDGTRCYGCGGSGRRYTKRGRAALDYWHWLCSVPASQLVDGDRDLDERSGRWGSVTVTANAEDQRSGHILAPDDPQVEEARARGAAIKPYSDGRVVVYEGFNVKIGDIGAVGGAGPDTLFRVSDRDIRIPVLKSVAAFQAGLTKAGKPRKR